MRQIQHIPFRQAKDMMMGIKEILLAFVIYYPHLPTKSLKWQSVTTATTTNQPSIHPAIELLSPVVSLVGPSPDLVFMIWTTHFSKNLCQMFAIRYAFHAWIFISFWSHSFVPIQFNLVASFTRFPSWLSSSEEKKLTPIWKYTFYETVDI